MARLKEAKKFVLAGSAEEDAGGLAGDEGMGSVLVQMMAGMTWSELCYGRPCALHYFPYHCPFPHLVSTSTSHLTPYRRDEDEHRCCGRGGRASGGGGARGSGDLYLMWRGVCDPDTNQTPVLPCTRKSPSCPTCLRSTLQPLTSC